MKNIVLAALLAAASFGAFAKPPDSKCLSRVQIFETAANQRDAGLPPEHVLGVLRQANLDMPFRADDPNLKLPNGLKPISEAQAAKMNDDILKSMINNVYFEPVNALPGEVLRDRILDACMNERPKYKPLK